jgi:signal transduction histidine kinase
MDGRGRLTLATEPQGNMMKVLIADTGCGMPKAVLNKIFDPFFTTKDPGEGTGLGLSIAHKIVTKYGGTIGLESEKGKGTTFTIQFPVGNN